jgi:DNA recombination protein RmuC
MEYIIYLIIGLIAGVVIGFLIAKVLNKGTSLQLEKEAEEFKNSINELTTQKNQLAIDKSILEERIANSVNHFQEQKEKINELEGVNIQLNKSLSEWKANYTNLQEKLTVQKAELEEIQKKFTTEFENIANKILEEKSQKFATQNQKNLDVLLNPFNEKLKDFGATVQNTYQKGLEERSKLQEQIKHLSELNQEMRKDAQNLTKALKQDSKTQGNWGEFILEKILQASGLKEGEEYKTQFSTTNAENKRIQPDIIIDLPDEKHIIVDAKVSLVAYENYVNTEDLSEQEQYLKAHILSIRNHIKGLSEKNYQSGVGLRTPDFVLLFMPIEPAFSLALQGDSDLYQYAWDRKIVIVSPTTLLATLKTVASIWKQERQNKNIIEIARQASALYDKFVGFLDDMEKIEKGINQADTAYRNALNKLKDGKGNLIRSTEKIRKLGLTTKKKISDDFLNDDDKLIS